MKGTKKNILFWLYLVILVGMPLAPTGANAACNGPSNGVVDAGEQCDKGAKNGACPETCSANCTINNCVVNECPNGTCKATCGSNETAGVACSTGGVCCTAASTISATGYFNPLKFDSLEGVLTEALNQLRNIIVILSIIFIIIGAIMYILSGGNEGRLTMAKGAITAALIGLAIAVAAPSFLKEIAALLGWTNVNNAQVTAAQTFTQIASNVLNFLLSVVGILAIIMLVFGGFTYLTSAGDESRAETGKKIVTYAVIAITVALSALVLVTQITKFFV